MFPTKSVFTLIILLIVNQVTLGQKNAIQNTLDSLRAKSGYPGIVFSYIDSNNGSHAFASGYANLEKKELMTINHKLHGGSTGKTIVSAIIMQLVEEDKISLDDKVSTYLSHEKWFNRIANYDDITIRNLLQHSSGIVRYELKEKFLQDLRIDPSKEWEPAELLSYVLDDEPPFEAGNGFTYADTNYILLGIIIEEIAKENFYIVAENRILSPIGIDGFHPTNKELIPNMAQGYYTEESEYALGFKSPFLVDGKPQNNMQFEWTGGGYAYKNADYAFLLKQIYEGRLFNMEELGDEFFNYIDAPEIGCQYGLGLMRFEFSGIGEFIGHSGFFPGYNTIGLYHTETKQSFAMQINSVEIDHLKSFFMDYMTLVKQVINK